MTYTPEQLREAAALIENLADEAASKTAEGDYSFKETYFFKTSNQLLMLAEDLELAAKGESVVVRVRVRDSGSEHEFDEGPSVYVRKRDGNYVAIYTGNNYSKGYYVNESTSPDVVEDLDSPVIWREW